MSIPVIKNVVRFKNSDVKFVTELSVRERLCVLNRLVKKYRRVEHMEMLLETIKLAREMKNTDEV